MEGEPVSDRHQEGAFVFGRQVTNVVSCFPHFWDKCLVLKQLKENGFVLGHSLRVQFIKVEKAGRWELEAAGHVASADSEQREERGRLCPTLFLFPIRQAHQPTFTIFLP